MEGSIREEAVPNGLPTPLLPPKAPNGEDAEDEADAGAPNGDDIGLAPNPKLGTAVPDPNADVFEAAALLPKPKPPEEGVAFLPPKPLPMPEPKDGAADPDPKVGAAAPAPKADAVPPPKGDAAGAAPPPAERPKENPDPEGFVVVVVAAGAGALAVVAPNGLGAAAESGG